MALPPIPLTSNYRAGPKGVFRVCAQLAGFLVYTCTVGVNAGTAQSPGRRYVQLAAGAYHSAALQANGTLWTWGRNNTGQLGDSTTLAHTVPVVVPTPALASLGSTWTEVAAGTFHTAALRSDGTLWTWGDNSSGQLGDGTFLARKVPTAVLPPANAQPNTYWVHVATGYAHTLAIRSDGSLWAWGANNYGQLGDGTTVAKSLPTQVRTALSLANEPRWLQITTSNNHNLGISTGGVLWAWGRNHLGQLGLGTAPSVQTQPRRVLMSGQNITWEQVSAGEAHTLALTATKSLWAWGINDSGQLGTGSGITYSPVPLLLATPSGSTAGSYWTRLAAGALHSLALRSDSTLWSWGEGTDGQVGSNQTQVLFTPVREYTRARWTLMAAGGQHSLAAQGGILSATGSSDFGQLGAGSINNSLVFRSITSSPLAVVAKYTSHEEVFPNPAQSTIWVNEASNNTICLLDLQGKEIQAWVPGTRQLHVENIASGLYLLRFQDHQGVRRSVRIMIQH